MSVEVADKLTVEAFCNMSDGSGTHGLIYIYADMHLFNKTNSEILIHQSDQWSTLHYSPQLVFKLCITLINTIY